MKVELFSVRCFGLWFGLITGVWLFVIGVHAQNEPYQLPSRGEWVHPEVVDTETMPRGIYRQNMQLSKIFFPRNPRAPYDPNKTSEGEGLSGGNIADGNWHHIAFVVDNNGGKLYVDGMLRASRGWNGTPSASSATMPLSFGYYNSPAGGYFAGEMDEVRLWNRAKSQREIIRDMQAILNGNETGLVGYWKLDGGHGTTAIDSNAPVQNGTLSGSIRWRSSTAPVDLVNVVFGTPRSFRLNAWDVNNDALTYTVLTNPTKGSLSGTPPNLTFTPVRSGMDGLSYRAADSLSNTNASLRLNILVTGDVNGDGCVDDIDLLLVLFSFGATGSLMPEDLNDDGTVDDVDLLIVLFNFGAGC